MKTITTLILVLFSTLFNFSGLHAQNICLVSADFQTGENYLIFWEQFADLTNLDSVIIYRKQETETAFTKIGAVDIEQNAPTYFADVNANTIVLSKYAISTLDSSGSETALSPWHQPMVLNFVDDGSGKIDWTKYKKEDQSDESYIVSYQYFIDEAGIGAFQYFGTVMNYDTMAFDTQFSAHPNSKYYVEASLPTCSIQTKANINTSRSNIKQQFSNASAGIPSISKSSISFELSPNPASDYITVELGKPTIGKLSITDLNGRVLKSIHLIGDFYTISIDDMANGHYFVNIEQNGVVSSKKFIKK